MKNLKKLTILHSNDMHGDFLAEQIDQRLVGGVSLLYKGAKAEEELSAAANALRLLSASATLARYDAPWGERNVILARKDAKTPKEYPRKAGTAAKKPL